MYTRSAYGWRPLTETSAGHRFLIGQTADRRWTDLETDAVDGLLHHEGPFLHGLRWRAKAIRIRPFPIEHQVAAQAFERARAYHEDFYVLYEQAIAGCRERLSVLIN